jgi:capsid protein
MPWVLILMTLANLGFSIDVNPTSIDTSARQFQYDALKDKGQRRASTGRITREDVIVRGGKRTQLQATANDVARNFSIAAWMIRRHLDYVARFQFHCKTGDRAFDRQVEELIRIQSRPKNFDRGGRTGRERFFRMLEARAVLDGDVGCLFVQGGRVQGIESDLIRQAPEDKQTKSNGYEWVDGVEIDMAGEARRYSLHRRMGGTQYEFVRNVPAYNMPLYGFWERFASEQVRGISPITASLNNFRDIYENLDYALIKAKLSQLFAVALMRDADAESLDQSFPPPAGEGDEQPTGDACEEKPKPRELNFANGPTVFDLDPGEKAEILESKTPSNELQQFTRLVTAIALKSLDIPYSFFDEAYTNYSGQRASWLHYERACLDRREQQIEVRTQWTLWQLQRFILEGWLTLPAGQTIADIKFQWAPLGMPWWDPVKEISGDLMAIASGMGDPEQLTLQRGQGDIYDNIDATLRVVKYAHERGMEELGEPLRLNFDPGPFAAAIMTQDAANEQQNNNGGSNGNGNG